MSGFFKIKTLLAWTLVLSPATGYWLHRGFEKPAAEPAAQNFIYEERSPAVYVPVEVVKQGAEHQTVYVSMGAQAVPEPGSSLLVVVTGLLAAFHRRR